MKKLLVILAVLASLNLSCDRKCGCSPPPPPRPLQLVFLSQSGEDLLSPYTTGAFSLNEIKLYKNSPDGPAIKFDIKKPVPAGEEKIAFYHLISDELSRYGSGPNWFSNEIPYIQFRNEQPVKINILYDSNRKIDLYLNGYEIIKEDKAPYQNSLFYLKKN